MMRKSHVLYAYNRTATVAKVYSPPATLDAAVSEAWAVRCELDRRISRLAAELRYLRSVADYLDAAFVGEVIVSTQEIPQ